MCKVRFLKDEVTFWSQIASWCKQHVSQETIDEFQILFEEDGGLQNFVEEKLRCLISDIKNQKVSLEGFTVRHAELLGDLLNCSSVNQNLLEELSGLIYGADERARYFNKWTDSSFKPWVRVNYRTLFLYYKFLLTLYTEKID